MTDRDPTDADPDAAALKMIREELGRTLFVEAGAGTGKTRALVERVAALVLGGTLIERIAAITFTEKAAAELKVRVRQRLEEGLRTEPHLADRTRTALESLDGAQISTIHAFCQGLLYLFAAEAGVDPSFQVQDEISSARRFKDRWRAFIEGLAKDDQALEVVDRVLGLGLATGDLEALASGLTARGDLMPLIPYALPPADPPDWSALSSRASALESLPLKGIPESDELRRRIELLTSVIQDIRRNSADREVILASAADIADWKFGRCGSTAAWGAALVRGRQACEQARDDLVTLLTGCRTQALRELMPLISRFVEEDAWARGRDGLMTFDDLILRVRGLLHVNPHAVRALRERFDVLLIDEFQDTDPLQVDIALAFATDPTTGEIEPGRLFLVGDPKQSIYRFRRADMAVYSRTKIALEAAGAGLVQLARNRRSRREIIDWVNPIFERLIGGGDRPEIQPSYRRISEHRADELAGPGVAYFGGEIAGATARPVRMVESRDVALHCRSIVDQKWQVAGRPGETPREASYRDIAILIPARTVLPALERALAEAGVPYRVEGGSLIYRTQEVRDLINCLTAIDDPADEVAIVGALRSPAFACSDLDIARFVAAGGRFNYLRAGGDASRGPVDRALVKLGDYHRRRHVNSLAALVGEFVTDSRLAEAGILDRGDRNSFRRMRYLAEQARSFEANGPESLRSLVQWLEGCCTQPAMLDHEGSSLDDDEDAVRVLTVHGAKGLEFPIVILAGMGTAPNSRPGNYLVDRSADTFAVQIGTKGKHRRFTLGDVDHLQNLEKEHCEAEFVRMLYVGATRARDHIVFSLYRTARATSAAALQLENAGATEGVHSLSSRAAPPHDGRRLFADLVVDPPPQRTATELEEQRRTLIEEARTQKYTSATRLGRRSEGKDSGDDESEPWSRGRAGTRLGRAVHAAVQSLSLQPDENELDAFARAQAVAEAIPQRSEEVQRLVRAALASAAASRARAAKRALREVPFAVPADGVIVEGFVDMLIETANGLEIVDWKTDQVATDEVTRRLSDYRLQAGLYVLGIERATGLPVNRVTYVFVSAGREESPGHPAELRDAALAQLLAPQT